MILHTPLPYEAIFPEENVQELKTEIHGTCMVEMKDGKINRIISTNPADYLNDKFKIGTKM